MSLKTWLAARKERITMQQRKDGYDWAAGQLLRGHSLDTVEMQIDDMFDTHTYPFDLGARDALTDWHRLSEQPTSHGMYVTQEMIDNFLRREKLDTERALIDRCPSCGVDRMYFGCFCDRA